MHNDTTGIPASEFPPLLTVLFEPRLSSTTALDVDTMAVVVATFAAVDTTAVVVEVDITAVVAGTTAVRSLVATIPPVGSVGAPSVNAPF